MSNANFHAMLHTVGGYFQAEDPRMNSLLGEIAQRWEYTLAQGGMPTLPAGVRFVPFKPAATPSAICLYCGAPNLHTSTHCPKCGAPMVDSA